ncbi:hypothetical protein ACJMK2_020081 [Sinanodonta woodiana]|uniref:Uncharacterized protein n=1 Tax=Sinanodonta woodiana TaxID=1069815 RepID=A0ABD3U0F7_SINWO
MGSDFGMKMKVRAGKHGNMYTDIAFSRYISSKCFRLLFFSQVTSFKFAYEINKQTNCRIDILYLFSKHLTGDLIKAVHELSEGVQLSKETENLLRKLEHPLPPGDQPIKLFALNYDVEKCNSTVCWT